MAWFTSSHSLDKDCVEMKGTRVKGHQSLTGWKASSGSGSHTASRRRSCSTLEETGSHISLWSLQSVGVRERYRERKRERECLRVSFPASPTHTSQHERLSVFEILRLEEEKSFRIQFHKNPFSFQ